MEGFILDHFPVVAEEGHGEFQVCSRRDVGGHDYVVGAVEEEFAEEFDGLAFGHVVRGAEEDRVVELREEGVVRGEVLRYKGFMFGEDFLATALDADA
jgi:hypothetical protein